MDSPFIGQIQLFAFNFAPVGWVLCNGQSLSISQNQALYALIGTTYGAATTGNFLVPNLLGAAPLPNMNYYIATMGLYPPKN